MAFRCEYVCCGNQRCKSCPHGPYWYEYWREKDRVRKRYHGKKDPRSKPEPSSAIDDLDAIFNKATATVTLACKILGGIGTDCSFKDGLNAYRLMSMNYHPDRAGNELKFQRINAAWSYLKAAKGWK